MAGNGGQYGDSRDLAQRMDRLRALAAAKEFVKYRQRAAGVLKDLALAARPDRAWAQEIVATVYREAGPEACAGTIESAGPAACTTLALESVLMLCRAPDCFNSAEDAAQQGAIRAAEVEFDPLMEAHAKVIRARVAEWAKDWPRMIALTQEAAKLAPWDREAQYWLARARLHQFGARIEAIPAVPGARWERLRAMIRLHTQRDFGSAHALVEKSRDYWRTLEKTEQELILSLLQPAMLIHDGHGAQEIRERARACELLESYAGERSWAQLVRGICEIRVDRAFVTASERLARISPEDHAVAPALAWLARTLGNLPEPVETAAMQRQWMAQLEKQFPRWPERIEIRPRLAMLALGRKEVEEAGRWLAQAPPANPETAYAQAVMAHRRGDSQSAKSMLESFGDRFNLQRTPYHLAARRLLAAMAERRGETEEAIRLHREIVAAHPGDAVTSARLARLMLEKAYASGEIASDVLDEARELLKSAGAIGWAAKLRMLCDLFSGDRSKATAALAALPAGDRSALKWRELAVHHWIARREPGLAREAFLGGEADQSSPTHPRALLILQAWELMEKVACSREPAVESIELEACAKEMAAVPTEGRDPLLDRWQFVVEQALAMIRDPGATPPLDGWEHSGSSMMQRIVRLFGVDEAQRKTAAGEILDALGSSSIGLDGSRAGLLKAICLWIVGREREYVEAFEILAKDAELRLLSNDSDPDRRLPISGSRLWLAAAIVWLSQKNWTKLLREALPACVADLSDPAARVVVGLGFAQAAVDDAERGDPRGAMKDVRSGRATLETMVGKQE